jgi:hypothetical protein
VLGEHLDDAAIGRELAAVGVFGKVLRQPEFLACLVNVVELVGSGFVGPKTRKLSCSAS